MKWVAWYSLLHWFNLPPAHGYLPKFPRGSWRLIHPPWRSWRDPPICSSQSNPILSLSMPAKSTTRIGTVCRLTCEIHGNLSLLINVYLFCWLWKLTHTSAVAAVNDKSTGSSKICRLLVIRPFSTAFHQFSFPFISHFLILTIAYHQGSYYSRSHWMARLSHGPISDGHR